MSIKLVKLNFNIEDLTVLEPSEKLPPDTIYYQVVKGSSETKSAEHLDKNEDIVQLHRQV